MGDAAARAAERVRRAHDGREADLLNHREGVVHRPRHAPGHGGEIDPLHRGAELLAVFGLVDRLGLGPDQLHAAAIQHPVFGQR